MTSALLALTMTIMPTAAPDWKLVWSDEFDGSGAPNSKKWNYEVGYIRNSEAQYYTKDRRENARIENGRLVIEARKDGFEGKPVTSASLTTEGIASWNRGRIEVRAKIPTGRGTWPAIWLLGNGVRTEGWPKCGEIDIMENVGFDPNGIHFNVHCEAYNHAKGTGKGTRVEVKEPFADFHTYAAEWYDDRIDFFLDGKKTFTYKKEKDSEDVWPFDKKHYLILNLAIGGGWGGQKGIDDAIYPSRYEIDYVRVYQTPEQLKQAEPEVVVQAQLEAYNARNLDAFVDTYAKDVKIFQHPSKLTASGHEDLRKRYGPLFKNSPKLNAVITRRIVQGNYVIDHESVTGIGEDSPTRVVAIYEVVGGKIQNVWFVR